MSAWWGFTPSRPIATDTGIRARSQRGAFVKHWWASRWIEAMEALVDPGRLQRGRRYARAGQVVALDETRAGVAAKVQGSRRTPYTVKLELARLSDAAWDAVLGELAERADLVADLLAGQMPNDVEAVFAAAGVALFPSDAGEIETTCSCPDWAVVCKHVAATHYLLAERLDADPFLLFRLRGRDEAAILSALRARQASGDDAGDGGPGDGPEAAPSLGEMVGNYWRAGKSLGAFETSVAPPVVPLSVLRRLGPPPFAPPDVDVARLLGPAYEAMTRRALELVGEGDRREIEGGNATGVDLD